MIETRNLCKSYGPVKALDSLNLHVEENEIFGFLGPNGAGKSTTINLLMGMIQPTSGEIRIAGIDVVKNPIEVKKIAGYLPENVGFYGHMTARQNLTYFAEFYKINGVKERIDTLLEIVGLAEAADKKVGGFSRGMRQRLGLAQALLNDPEIVFLDEPTSGLDPEGAAEFRNLVSWLEREGKTVFFSSHILSEVRAVCRTIGIISRGRLVVKGDMKELTKKLNDSVRIFVETEPQLNDESILKSFASRIEVVEKGEGRNRKYMLECDRDCRTEVAKTLFEMGYVVKELHLQEPSLEEIYLKIIQEGAA
jgi:ABC-2 type transport system ATP-binding protein